MAFRVRKLFGNFKKQAPGQLDPDASALTIRPQLIRALNILFVFCLFGFVSFRFSFLKKVEF